MIDTPRTDEAMDPKNYGAYTNGEGGVTALECAFEQVVTLCRQLERELRIETLKVASWERYKANIDEALNTGDGSYKP